MTNHILPLGQGAITIYPILMSLMVSTFISFAVAVNHLIKWLRFHARWDNQQIYWFVSSKWQIRRMVFAFVYSSHVCRSIMTTAHLLTNVHANIEQIELTRFTVFELVHRSVLLISNTNFNLLLHITTIWYWNMGKLFHISNRDIHPHFFLN